MLAPLGQAIDALSAEVAGLLTSSSAPQAPQILILDNSPGLAGLGGFVGLSTTPMAEVYARHLDAEIAVRVFADTTVALANEVDQASRDLLSFDSAQLRQRGIFSIKRLTERETPILTPADGLATAFGRDLHFRIRFEHKPLPTTPGGVLGSVPVDTMTAGLSRDGGLIYANDFTEDPLSDFLSEDRVGTVGTPGNWSYDAGTQELIQTGTVRGGNNGLRPNKSGTYLTLRPALGGDVTNFVVNTEVRNGSEGGIGFVFRYTGIRDFGYVLLEESAGVRVMGTRINNRASFLEEGGQDATVGYDPDTWMRLRLLVDGGRMELAINEVPVLTGRDATLIQSGSVGLFCRRANTARFRHFRLSSL